MTKLESLILGSAPAAYISRKSKRTILPGSNGLSLHEIGTFFFRQVNKVGLTERASAISFNLIMALPAALLFLFSLIPYFPKSENVRREIFRLLKDITPNSVTFKFVNSIVDDILNTQHGGIFSFGFLLLIFYASNAMLGVIKTFDKSIQEHKRVFFHKRMRAIRLTFILIILVLVSIVALLVGKEQMIFLMKNVFNMKRADRISWWNATRWLIIITLLFYGICFIYKYAPSVKKRWKLVSPGSLLATALTLLTAIIFSYWVNNFASYNKVYGSIGTMLIIMVLIYINSLILLIGFELNVSIAYLTREAEEKRLQERVGSTDELS
ncbi:MAG: Membrane protein [Sediminibacterium sp.]|nr:Membrane protein [Sediminibacterium sp.]